MNWSPFAAGSAALAFLMVFWLLYDAACRVVSQRKNGDALVGALVLVLVCAASWLACHWFAGRAAFSLAGAMMATAMSANVLFWILPGQRTVIASIKAGQRGKQRSVHNTYFTLPVLFTVLSNHYSFTWSHPQNWLVLILMMLAGAAIRQFFVLRNGYKLGRNRHPAAYAAVGVAVIVGVIVWIKPRTPDLIARQASEAWTTASNDYQAVQKLFENRCYAWHGANVQMKNIRLDFAALVKQHAQSIYQHVVVTKIMPMNNATGITDAERRQVKNWFEAGATTDGRP